MKHSEIRAVAIKDDDLVQRMAAITDLGFEIVQHPGLFGATDGLGISTTAGEPVVIVPYDEDVDNPDDAIRALIRAWDAGHLTLN